MKRKVSRAAVTSKYFIDIARGAVVIHIELCDFLNSPRRKTDWYPILRLIYSP